MNKTLSGNPFDFDQPWIVEQYPSLEESYNTEAEAPQQDNQIEMCCDAGHRNEAGGICCPIHYPNTCGYHG